MAAMSEREKMVAGELYYAMVPELAAAREAARDLSREYNNSSGLTPEQLSARRSILKRLVGSFPDDQPPCVEQPFQCDYVSVSRPHPPPGRGPLQGGILTYLHTSISLASYVLPS